jgi:hypothetical protein
LVGRDLNDLIELSVAVAHSFVTTTLVETEDVIGRTQRGAAEGFDAIVAVLAADEDGEASASLTALSNVVLIRNPKDLTTQLRRCRLIQPRRTSRAQVSSAGRHRARGVQR